MILSEFKSKFFSRPTIAPPTTLYVFKSEDSAESWIECKYFGSDKHDYELDMVIQSDMILKYTVKDKWCKAEVQQFYAVEPDVIVVVVELAESEDKE
jgi:hypothetical protein